MSEARYEALLLNKENRAKLLEPYEQFVKSRLTAHPLASAAQVHDWLKEHYRDFSKTSAKPVYNFVMAIGHKYYIALDEGGRQYFVVQELP